MKKFLTIALIASALIFYSCNADDSSVSKEESKEKSIPDPDTGLDNSGMKFIKDITTVLLTHPPQQVQGVYCHQYYPDGKGGRGVFTWNGRYYYVSWYKDVIFSITEVTGGSAQLNGLCTEFP